MLSKKNFLSALATFLIGGNILIAPTTNAEVRTYIGEGEYLMNDFETPEVAKQRAKARAEQNAQEQAGVYLESYSHMKNFELLSDEIISISSGIMKILDVQFTQDSVANGQGILIHATIQAEIDSDNMDKWLNKSLDARRTINAKLEELRRTNSEQEKIISDLKSQLATGNVPSTQIVQEIQQQDKIFMFSQKIAEGWKYYAEENYRQAVESFAAAINLNPRNDEGYFGRGTAYNELNDNQSALADYNKAIEIAPNYYAYNNRGKTNFELHNFSAALEDFNKALQVNPQDVTAYINRGKIYFELRRIAQGMADFDKAVSLQPNNFQPYVQRAAAHYALGKFDSSLQDLNTAIELNPDNAESYSYRAEVFTELKNYSAALKDFNKSIELNPNDGETFYLRGKCHQALGETAKAKADFNTAKKLGYKSE